jgi:peptidoglycan/LPS O-acetylase OafA/YrhL
MKLSLILNRENNNLDLIRVVLACLVIVGHAPILNGVGDIWVDPFVYFFKFTYSAALAVKLFFFISGLVVTNSLITKKSATHFVVSRVFRLIPALFFVLIITVFVFGPALTTLPSGDYFSNLDHLKYIFNNLVFKTEYYLPGMFAANVYPSTVNGSLWSLTYEVGCYIGLLGTFLVLQGRHVKYWKYFFLVILADTLLPNRIIFAWLGANPDFYLLPVIFSFGAFCAIYAHKITVDLKLLAGMCLICFLFKNTTYAQISFMLAACITVLYISSNKYVLRLKPRYDISYGVYLWGFLIQQTLFQYFGHIAVGMHCLLAIIISMALGLITHIFIEKPFMDIGKHVYKVIQYKYFLYSKISDCEPVDVLGCQEESAEI